MSLIKRRVRQAGVYFVTAKTWQGRRLFANPERAKTLLDRILGCRDRGFYQLHAFVIMPDHFHAMITPAEQTTLERALQMIKGGSSYELHRENASRFPVWQKGFHDRWIRDGQEYRTRKNYLEQNPVRAGLAPRAEAYSLTSPSGNFSLDASRFDPEEGTSGAEARGSGASERRA